jgi:hypothetical protein
VAWGGRESVDHPLGGNSRDDAINSLAGAAVQVAITPSQVRRWLAAYLDGPIPAEPGPAQPRSPREPEPPQPELVVVNESLRPTPGPRPYSYSHDAKELMKLMTKRK